MTDDDVKESLKPNILEIVKADDVGRFKEIIRDDYNVFGTLIHDRTIAHLCAIFGAKKILLVVVGFKEFDLWHRDTGGKLAIDHALAKNFLEIHDTLYQAMYPPGWFLDSGDSAKS